MLTTPNPQAPQGAIPLIGIPDSRDIPRLVYTAPYFVQSPLAELLEPAVQEAVEAMLPALVPPYVDGAASAAVQELAVLLTGSSMSGPLMLSPLMPTADTMAATKAYVDTMISTAGVPEVPAVPVGQTWAREVGQWVPLVDDPGGPFLQLSGGVMQGQINMSGNAITNLPAVPVMPNGAASAQWVLQQISSVSLYQGIWNLDTMTPDLTAPSTHVNGYTWIAVTVSTTGVVIATAVPGLQGKTVYNGDHVIWSSAQGNFSAMHSGGLTLPEADARYLQLVGGQMSGALLLHANATAPTQAVTLQQLTAAVAGAGLPEAPTDGQVYGRNGVTHAWAPALPLVGGVLSGPLTLSGNATLALQAVPKQQLDANLATAVSGYLPIAGGVAMSGLFELSGNAGANLNPVPLQQVNAMLNNRVLKAGDTMTGPLVLTVPLAASSGGTGTASNTLDAVLTGNGANPIKSVPVSISATGQITVTHNGVGNSIIVNAPVATDAHIQFHNSTTSDWIVGAQGLAGPGEFWLYNNKSPAVALAVQQDLTARFGGNIALAGATLSVGQGIGATMPVVEIGNGRVADGFAALDFHAATASPDFDTRIYRDPGTNGNAHIQNAGTGNFDIFLGGTALTTFNVNGTLSVPGNILGSGNVISVNNVSNPTVALTNPTGTPLSLGLINSSNLMFTAVLTSGLGYASTMSTLDVSGNLTIAGATATKPGGGTWTAPSDLRLKDKDSILPYTRGLDALLKLQPITYEYNGAAGMPKDVRFHGLVADDAKVVMPEAVGSAALGQQPGSSDTGEEYLTFDQTPLLYALVNSVKELAAQIAELKGAAPAAQRRNAK